MKKLKVYLVLAGVICLFGYVAYKLIYRGVRDNILNKGAVRKMAVIIDKKNYMGNSPVSHEYSYSYMFVVNGKSYENDSNNPKLLIGDFIEIEYDNDQPSFNRPAVAHK